MTETVFDLSENLRHERRIFNIGGAVIVALFAAFEIWRRAQGFPTSDGSLREYIFGGLLLSATLAGANWLMTHRKLVVSPERITFTSPSSLGGFSVPVVKVRRLTWFARGRYSVLTFEMPDEPVAEAEVVVWNPGQRLDLPILAEIERVTGLSWIGRKRGPEEGLRSALQRVSGGKTGRPFRDWMAQQAIVLRFSDLGLNDPLLAWGFRILAWHQLLSMAGSVCLLLLLRNKWPTAGWVIPIAFAYFLLAYHTLTFGVNLLLRVLRSGVDVREAHEGQLAAARKVQNRLMPQRAPSLPGFEISGFCEPAHDVGGDYYDFIQRPDGGLATVVADVSGKGLSAGLLMTLTKGSLAARLERGDCLKTALTGLNQTIRGSSHDQMFITMAVAELPAEGSRVRLARAGHPPALSLPASGPAVFLQPAGIGLGLASGPLFERTCAVMEIDLAPGDALVLYTDGLTEAMSPASEEYGDERLLAAANAARSTSAAALQASILTDVAAFRGGAPAHDDLTLVVVRRAA